MMKSRISALLFALVIASSLAAQTAEDYTRVLFPIVSYDDLPGANGSLWRTSLSVVNVGAEPAQLGIPHVCINCRTARALRPNLTYAFVPIPGSEGIPGSFLFVDKDDEPNLRYGISVRDVSRQDDNLGVEIPIARERDFRTDRISLLNIPRDDRYRYHLRLYSLQSGQVTITTYEEAGTIPNGEGTLTTDAPLGTMTATIMPPSPRDFRSSYPGFASVTDIAGLSGTHERLARLDIVPAPGVTVWAFLTITNNETQDVTVVSPQ